MAESEGTSKLRKHTAASPKHQDSPSKTSPHVTTKPREALQNSDPSAGKPRGATKHGGSPGRGASPTQAISSPKRQGPPLGTGASQKRVSSPRPGGSPSRGASLVREGLPAHGGASPKAGSAPSPTFQHGSAKPRESRRPVAPDKGNWWLDNVLGALGALQGNEEPRSRGASPAGSARPSVEDVGSAKRPTPEAVKRKAGTTSPQGSPRSSSPRPATKEGSAKRRRSGSVTDRPEMAADRDSAHSFIEHVSSRSKIWSRPKATTGINFRMAVIMCSVAVLLAVIVIIIAWQLIVVAEARQQASTLGSIRANSSGKHGRSCTGESCASNATDLSRSHEVSGIEGSPLNSRPA